MRPFVADDWASLSLPRLAEVEVEGVDELCDVACSFSDSSRAPMRPSIWNVSPAHFSCYKTGALTKFFDKVLHELITDLRRFRPLQ